MAPKPPTHGRGAQSGALSRRFNLPAREVDGDWRDEAEEIDGPPPKLRTTVTVEHPRTILSFNKSPDIGFDRSINAYRGCEHGCIYCFARPTHAYLDLSPGLDFETKLFAKPNAPELLRKTLAKKNYQPRPIAMGTNTDPYQPIEGTWRITRRILEICLETRHPVTITTKSDRVTRDLDLLAELARHRLTHVAISVTSLDPQLSRKLEPRAPTPARRVDALRRLAEAGVPAYASIAPVIPAITDDQIEAILDAVGKAGVSGAGWILMRLPHEVAPLFREWLQIHFPDRAEKVMGIVRAMRGGRDNVPEFHKRFQPEGPWAELFRARFRLAKQRAGIPGERFPLDLSQFRPPPPDRGDGQMDLFGGGR
ncbi:MAG: PA0069 family radical SAM protein [Candidatus Andeanibacterium colombiense]|uniref:PA0069 family radical SAM protein n=1 Tax=Candidatus Andeanibacterium colombiense TaxID=3121345 RepID=A0AAJ6BPP7_9SPHN|nr:MAG: PA0069 family radical SAM protein [Sphingomonadaceae bacterium]